MNIIKKKKMLLKRLEAEVMSKTHEIFPATFHELKSPERERYLDKSNLIGKIRVELAKAQAQR